MIVSFYATLLNAKWLLEMKNCFQWWYIEIAFLSIEKDKLFAFVHNFNFFKSGSELSYLKIGS